VYLRGEADLAPAADIADRAEQGRFVYERLTGHARASQAKLRGLLDRARASYESYWIANVIRVTGDDRLLHEITALPEVAQVTADRLYRLPEPSPGEAEQRTAAVEWGIDRIRAPQVWDTFGVTGQDIVVATIDTGVRFGHSALVAQYLGNLGDGTFDHNYRWWDPSQVCGSPSVAPCDNNGHGTHVTGTVVDDDGGNNQIGVAPGAKWIAAKGCETNSGLVRDLDGAPVPEATVTLKDIGCV
jgi:subtilisin family serine protease